MKTIIALLTIVLSSTAMAEEKSGYLCKAYIWNKDSKLSREITLKESKNGFIGGDDQWGLTIGFTDRLAGINLMDIKNHTFASTDVAQSNYLIATLYAPGMQEKLVVECSK